MIRVVNQIYKRKLEEIEAEAEEEKRIKAEEKRIKAEEEAKRLKEQEEAMQSKNEKNQGVYSNAIYAAEAVEYLKTCALDIDVDASTKHTIVTQKQPLDSIPHWCYGSDANFWKKADVIEFLEEELREFIPMVEICSSYANEDKIAFVLEIPTDFSIEEEIKKYQSRIEDAHKEMANCEYQFECWRTTISEYESTLQVWKKLKEEAP
jgi:hypothetical protein